MIHALFNDRKLTKDRRRITSADFERLRKLFSNFEESFRVAISPSFKKKSLSQSHFLRSLSAHNDVLKNFVEKVWRNNRTNQQPIKNCRKKLQSNENSPNNIRRRLKLDAEAIRKYTSSLGGEDVRCYEVNGLKYRAINVSATKNIDAYLEKTMSLQEAAIYLCYRIPELRLLAKVGLIKSQTLEVKPRTPRFHRECLDEWLQLLTKTSVPVLTISDELVRLTDIAAHTANGDVRKPWLRLMEKIKSRHIILSLIGHPLQASNFYVNSQDLKEIHFRKEYLGVDGGRSK